MNRSCSRLHSAARANNFVRAGVIAVFVAIAGFGCADVQYGRGYATYDETDRSLTLEAYAERGVPSTERDWSDAQRDEALETLATLVARRADELPRLDSPRSRPLFEKLVNNDRLGFIGDGAIPPQIRMSRLSAEMDYEVRLMGVYATAHGKTGMYGDELALLLARGVWATARELDLRVALLRDGQPLLLTDPAKELASLQGSITDLAVFAAKVLGNRQGLSPGARQRLADGIAAPMATIAPELTSLNRTQVRGHFQRLVDGEEDAGLRARFERLLALVGPTTPPSRLVAAAAERPVAPPGAFGWSRYSGPSGARFSAEFPGRPIERTSQSPGSGPFSGLVYTSWTRAADGTRYAILRIRLQADVPEQEYLDAFHFRFQRQAIVGDRRINLENGMPTREIELSSRHVAIARAVASGGDVTEMYVESTGTDLAALRRKAERFFRTVTIEPLDVAEPGTPSRPGSITSLAPPDVQAWRSRATAEEESAGDAHPLAAVARG